MFLVQFLFLQRYTLDKHCFLIEKKKMHYFPSMYTNMTPASCLQKGISNYYPMQDSKSYFVNQQMSSCANDGANTSPSGSLTNDDVTMGNNSSDHHRQFMLSGPQLSQMKNRQLLNRHHGKRGRIDETVNGSDSCVLEDSRMTIDMDDDHYGLANKRNRRTDMGGSNNMNSSSMRESDNWPTFKHPDGGVLKFTPHGTIRSFFDDAKGIEVSILENSNGCSFGSFPR